MTLLRDVPSPRRTAAVTAPSGMTEDEEFFADAARVLGVDTVAHLRARAARRLRDQPLSEAQLVLLSGLMARADTEPQGIDQHVA